MKEITDPTERYSIETLLQRIPIHGQAQFKLRRAWELSSPDFVSVELADLQSGFQLMGILDSCRCLLYLDQSSMMLLVTVRIQEELDAFNAGKHWRYKGL